MLLGLYTTELVPNWLAYYNLATNWLAGFCFFGVAYFMNSFINRVLKNTSNKNNTLWIFLSRRKMLFVNLTMVFFFCGLGHILQGYHPWAMNRYGLEIVLTGNAVFGCLLVIRLIRMFYV